MPYGIVLGDAEPPCQMCVNLQVIACKFVLYLFDT